jgi:predicted metal-binding protein
MPEPETHAPPVELRKGELLLVCKKCVRRSTKKSLGKRRKLPARLAAALRARRGSKEVRVVAVKCLGVCPKGRVVVGRGRVGEPFRLLLVAPKANAEEVIDALEAAHK